MLVSTGLDDLRGLSVEETPSLSDIIPLMRSEKGIFGAESNSGIGPDKSESVELESEEEKLLG